MTDQLPPDGFGVEPPAPVQAGAALKRRLNLTPPETVDDDAEHPSAQIASDLYSQDAEESVVGSVLINPDEMYPLIAPILKGEDFYFAKNRWVWEAFTILHGGGLPIDLLTVAEVLDRRNHLAEIGGASHLSHLLNVVPTSLHGEAYARIVQADATRRRLLDAATRIAKLAYVTSSPIDDCISKSQHLLTEVAKGARGLDTLKHISATDDAMREMFGNPSALRALYLPTGLAPLDGALGWGLEAKTNTILLGRSGMGKTAVQCQIVLNNAPQSVIVFFSKEMPQEMIHRRMACALAGINWHKYRDEFEKVTKDELQRVSRALDIIYQYPHLFIDDSASQTTDDVRRVCERVYNEHGRLDLVVGDHLRLFDTRRSFEREDLRLGHIAWTFKQIAKDLNTRCLVSVQMNNAVDARADKRPQPGDIRGSGEIFENADNVIGMYSEGFYSRRPEDNIMEFILLKLREGDTNGAAHMAFIKEFQRFVLLATKDQQAHAPAHNDLPDGAKFWTN
jgi:replicative DNA helicase